MRRYTKYFIVLNIILLVLYLAGCGKNYNQEQEPSFISYAGTRPVGDFIVILIDRANSLIRHINYTSDPDEDSGWLSYTPVQPGDINARGFSILNRVEIGGGKYVLFAEFYDTALVYQEFNPAGECIDWPEYVAFRETVNKDEYYEKAYNWMEFKIRENPVDDSLMGAGFAAFDSASAQGLLYGAGYSSAINGIHDINNGSSRIKVNDFTYSEYFIANIIWGGTVGDMNYASVLAGTASGTNILDYGPAAGGGSGIAIPQSDVSLSNAAGTYFFLAYENNQTQNRNSIKPMKLVISPASPHVKVFQYSSRTDTGVPDFTCDLIAVENLTANQSPGGAVPLKDQYAAVSGNSTAVSAAVRNANLCKGSFAFVSSNLVINFIFDQNGRFCAFTIFDNVTADHVIRFGIGIKDANYTNQ